MPQGKQFLALAQHAPETSPQSSSSALRIVPALSGEWPPQARLPHCVSRTCVRLRQLTSIIAVTRSRLRWRQPVAHEAAHHLAADHSSTLTLSLCVATGRCCSVREQRTATRCTHVTCWRAHCTSSGLVCTIGFAFSVAAGCRFSSPVITVQAACTQRGRLCPALACSKKVASYSRKQSL